MADESTKETIDAAVPRLVAGVLRSEHAAIARVMREIEDEAPRSTAFTAALFAHTGRAKIVGITGSPGAGKSTLLDRLIEAWRAMGLRVGVVAIDPSSPLHGGALLGDRIRMLRHTNDPGTYVRSMASRGERGGLALKGGDLVDVLDAAGMDVILIETVGVGQDGVDIMHLAHSVIVVQSPGQGDEIQAMKAGILEIADILVVNKCDLPGADQLIRDLKLSLTLMPVGENGKLPEIICTQALTGDGIRDLARAVLSRGDNEHGTESQRERSERQLEYRFKARLHELISERVQKYMNEDRRCRTIKSAMHERTMDPGLAASEVFESIFEN